MATKNRVVDRPLELNNKKCKEREEKGESELTVFHNVHNVPESTTGVNVHRRALKRAQSIILKVFLFGTMLRQPKSEHLSLFC